MYKQIIAFGLGVIAGAGGMYLYLQRDKDVEVVQEEENGKDGATEYAKLEEPVNDDIPRPTVNKEYYEKSYDYLYKQPSDEVDPAWYESPDDSDDEHEEESFADNGKPPRIISAHSYWNEYDHFEKRPLIYYTDDDVLVYEEYDTSATTEEGEIIVNREALIGDALTRFDFAENDSERVIYVRNYRLGVDYEINKVFGVFQEDENG